MSSPQCITSEFPNFGINKFLPYSWQPLRLELLLFFDQTACHQHHAGGNHLLFYLADVKLSLHWKSISNTTL